MKINRSSINFTTLVLLFAPWGDPPLGVLAVQNMRGGNNKTLADEVEVGKKGDGGGLFRGHGDGRPGVEVEMSSYVNPMNEKYAHIYDLYEMKLDGFSIEEHHVTEEEMLQDKSGVIPNRSGAMPNHTKSVVDYPIRDKNPNRPEKKEKDPSYVHSTTMKEVMEKLKNDHGRNLAVNFGDAQTALLALQAANNGDLEMGLDILADVLVTSICLAGSMAAAGPTMGMSLLAAPMGCAMVAYFTGLILAGFEWVGDTIADNAYWTVEAADSNWADGNSLEIAYHRDHGTDKDSLGNIKRGEIKTSQEDLDKQTVRSIEVFIDDTDDVCVKSMEFKLNRQPSGTGKIERISISAPVFSLITGAKLQNAQNGQQMCVNFGDAEGAIGRFKFNWRSALTCHNNFGAYFTVDYNRCLSNAMHTYDVRRNGRYDRSSYRDGNLPSYYSSPFRAVTSKANTNMCFDVAYYRMDNFNPINLIDCKSNDAQRFDFDNEGRIRSVIDKTKCIEAGSSGTLYNKLFIYDCHGGDWQKWTRYASGRIQNKYHGKYIGLAHCQAKSGNPLELRWYEDGSCGDAQKWNAMW